jgi:hypothetical protein
MACVYELVRTFGQCTRKWADPPIQNRRIRRCGGGLEHVPLRRSSPVRTEERDHGPRCPSRPFVTSQHHVGVFACALPPVLKCCGVVQRQPGDGRCHNRGAVGPYPRHRCWHNERWRAGPSIRPHNIDTLAARTRAESVNTSCRVYASHVG